MSDETGWSAVKRVVSEALDELPSARRRHIRQRIPDPARRGQAERLLLACERASSSPVLGESAVSFAAPVLAEVTERDRHVPESLRTELRERYAIGEEIGRGGMATVYLAHDERHGRAVAFKLLKADLLADRGSGDGARRFRREIENAARMSHPHILPLYDSGASGGHLYYTTPYVEGETLRDRLRRGPVPLRETLHLLRDVASALAHAHRHGLVHCDIKPSNILLGQDGDVRVADFGVARGMVAARGGTAEAADDLLSLPMFGTPAYMAPEQAAGEPGIDHRADLFSLGVVAYELLTGVSPFEGRPPRQPGDPTPNTSPPVATREPAIPGALADLVDRLIAPRAGDRPADAGEVLRVLEAVVAGEAGSRTGGSVRPVAETSDEDARRGSRDRQAREAFLKGRYLAGTRQHDGLRRAIAYFEQAAARDPAFAGARAGLAEAWSYLGIFGHVAPSEAYPKARAAAEVALELEPRMVQARATLAHLKFVGDWEWENARADLERVIALDPRYPTVRVYYASLLHTLGHPAEALAQLAVARELDPLSPTSLLTGRIHVDTRRPDLAIPMLEEEIELDPRLDVAHQLLSHAYLQSDRPEEAIASMRRAAALSGARDRAQLAYVHARAGDAGTARGILDELLGEERSFDLLGFHLAMAYAGLEDADTAFRWLEAACATRASFMNLLAVSAGFDAIRSDPRFEGILDRMGLRSAPGGSGPT